MTFPILGQKTVTTTGGTANSVAKFSGAKTIVNSAIVESGGKVGIGTTAPASTLTVNGVIQSLSGGVMYPDGTSQSTAALVGPQGPMGPQGPSGIGIITPGGANSDNTGVGTSALQSVTSGTENTATGYMSLHADTTGRSNTASGAFALSLNSSGTANTALGAQALYLNQSGQSNTAVGVDTLENSNGSANTGVGANAMQNNTTGNSDTAVGSTAMLANTTGAGNTALGGNALQGNTIGSNNTALGNFSLPYSTGSGNIGVGASAGISLQTGDNNIYIGAPGNSSESNVISIGTPGQQTSVFLAGVSGVNIASGTSVVISPTGQLGVLSSSRRYKDSIQQMGSASDSLMRLRPVTFRYKGESAGTEYGLIAEEVADVYPEAVVRNSAGQPEAVQYHKINAMLLNEVQKQHQELAHLQAQIDELKSMLARAAR